MKDIARPGQIAWKERVCSHSGRTLEERDALFGDGRGMCTQRFDLGTCRDEVVVHGFIMKHVEMLIISY